jgi:uncharacterized RDD family membrane protein YckC
MFVGAQALEALPRRLLALIADLVFLGVLSLVVNQIFGTILIVNQPSGAFSVTITAFGWPWQVLIALAYFLVPETVFGATPGKRLFGLCVVRADGSQLGVRELVVRNLLRVIDWLPFLYIVGGAFALLGGKCQRFGDVVAQTTVVSSSPATELGLTRTPSPRLRRFAGVALVAVAMATALFDYFGRPPLIIEALYNAGHMPIANSGYSLGPVYWTFGHVRYVISGRQANSPSECLGSIDLEWQWFGWHETEAYYACGIS